MIPLQPTLRGELLLLRPLAKNDFESLYRAACDPLIWELHPDPNRHTRKVFTEYFRSGMESGGAFAIIEKVSGDLIGSSRYYDSLPEEKKISVGYTFLERKFWGGRYNYELKKLMLDHAFRYVDLVDFEIGEKNFRSRRAIEKIGAWLVGSKKPGSVTYRIDAKSLKTK